MLVKTYSAAVNGLDVTTVTVEVNIVPGVMYRMTGLGDTAVREGRDRIASALQVNGYKFPHADITINLAPADLRKEGSSFDLPLAMAILTASGAVTADTIGDYMLVGELSLDGTLQPVKGALPIAIASGRSNELPSLRRSAGARLMVMSACGNLYPFTCNADAMRSRPSRTAVSPSPVMRYITPGTIFTSTVTVVTSRPLTAAE
jgi:hypothetical protein